MNLLLITSTLGVYEQAPNYLAKGTHIFLLAKYFEIIFGLSIKYQGNYISSNPPAHRLGPRCISVNYVTEEEEDMFS